MPDNNVSQELCEERMENHKDQIASAIAALGTQMTMHYTGLKSVVDDVAHSARAAHERIDPLATEVAILKREAEESGKWPTWVTAILLPIAVPLLLAALMGGIYYMAQRGRL